MTPDQNPQPPKRRIRSFVLREGRLTTGQQRAFELLWPRWGATYTDAPLDPRALFERPAALYLEIGFGNGDSLVQMAAAHPERNYLGIEVHRPGVGHLLLQLEQQGCDNVRVMRHDAVEVLTRMAPGCLDGVYLFFPDPWHKKRHHKRRILQAPLIRELARCLVPGGLLHTATDWQDYAEHMLRELTRAPEFANHAEDGGYCPRPGDRPLTKFERRGQGLGHGVWDLIFRRRG